VTRIAVDPAEYFGAANQFASVSRDGSGELSRLAGKLGASGGMGGSDHAGTEWATSYDEVAKGILAAATAAANGAANVGGRLHASGENYAQADAASVIGGGQADVPSAPSMPGVSAPSVPSAAGGSSNAPFGWSLVEGLVGYLWPNGHQDQLHAAADAWKATAKEFDSLAGSVDTVSGRVSSFDAPEAETAGATCAQVAEGHRDLAGACREAAKSCDDYAHHLDEAHHQIIEILEELALETIAFEVGAAVLALVSAGMSEIAAQAAVAARIANAANKIRRVIELFMAAVRTVGASIKAVGVRAAEILGKLKPIAEARIRRSPTLGSDAKAIAAPEGLSASEAAEYAENLRIREWYDSEALRIKGLNDQWIQEGFSPEERARMAAAIRHENRLTAREMMSNPDTVAGLRARDTQLYGNPDGPTFDDLVAKGKSKALGGDDVYEYIIDSSTRTNADVNKSFGIGGPT